jgi:hypothetical protein
MNWNEFLHSKDVTTLLSLVLVFLGVLILFVLGLWRQRSKLMSGQEVAHQQGWLDNGRFHAETDFNISQPGRWCRIAADFDVTQLIISDMKVRETEQRMHRFQFVLSDDAGKQLFVEEKPLEHFFLWTKSVSQTVGSFFYERESATQKADNVPLLEFIPPYAGRFHVSVSLPETGFARSITVDAESRILSFVVHVREDVAPLAARAYPHQRLDLNKR